MSLTEFNKRFGLRTNIKEEQKKFVIRIDDIILDSLSRQFGAETYRDIIKHLC